MYITYKETKYPCKCSPGASITYRGLPADFPHPVSGAIRLYANDGFHLRTDFAEDYLRQTFEEGVLTLTNLPEPVEPDPIEPIEEEPTTAEILDALLGVKNDE
jgi:hypothetical protein